MKTLNRYIIESKQSEYNFFCENFTKLFKDIKITNNIVQNMLNNLDIKLLKQLSDYYVTTDIKNYITYQPSDDMFTETNKQIITKQISDYIVVIN